MGLGQVPSVSTTIAPATSKSNYPLSLVLCQMLLSQSSSEQLLLPSSVLVPPCSAAKGRRQFLYGGVCTGRWGSTSHKTPLCYSLAA